MLSSPLCTWVPKAGAFRGFLGPQRRVWHALSLTLRASVFFVCHLQPVPPVAGRSSTLNQPSGSVAAGMAAGLSPSVIFILPLRRPN